MARLDSSARNRATPQHPFPGCRPRRRPGRWAVISLALFAVSAGSLHGQNRKADKKGSSKAPFEGIASVIQVEVPVNVVDKNGHPVRGLTGDDFEILDDGRSQELIGFEIVDLDAMAGEMALREAERRIEELPSVARRHFLLLFDFSFSSTASIMKARMAAREFVLGGLHPTDLVAVATVSVEWGPQLVMAFTPDRAQLARAVDMVGVASRPGNISVVDPLRFFIGSPGDLADLTSGPDLDDSGEIREAITNAGYESMRAIGQQMERGERSFQERRVTGWSRAMSDMARTLNSVPGRKHVVFFSDGFDSSLLLGERPELSDEQVQNQLETQRGGLGIASADMSLTFGSTALQKDINQMLEEFRRADCIIQAVKPSGLIADGNTSYGRGSGSEGLFYLANETGGALFEDSNNLAGQLDDVLERSDLTYILSFQPEKIEWNGEYHRLKVKLKGNKGARLSHRAGYYAPRPFAGLHPMEKTLLASDAIASAEPTRDIELDVLATPFRANDQAAYVPVILEVQGKSLLLGQEDDQLVVEIYAYVTNPRGEMRDFFSHTAGFDISNGREAFAESGLKYYGHLELPAGEDYLLRVLVRNAGTGRTGVHIQPLRIPPYDDEKLAVLTPFFFDDPQRWVMLRERRDEGEEKSVVYPFTLEGEPFVPSARPSFKIGESAELCLVAYNFGEGRLALESWVEGPDGQEIQGGRLASFKRTVTGISGVDKLRVDFHSQGLDAGEYTLRVALKDSSTGDAQSSSIPFIVTN